MFVTVSVSASVSRGVLAPTIVIGPSAVLLVVTTPHPAPMPARRLECQLRHSWGDLCAPFLSVVFVVAAFFVSCVVFILARGYCRSRGVRGGQGGMAVLCPLPVTLHH